MGTVPVFEDRKPSMNTRIVFPWLKLKKPIEVDGFKFTTYELEGQQVNGEASLQHFLASVKEIFSANDGQQIKHVTILQLQMDNTVRDIGEREIVGARNLSELLAFSGLSCRDYFSDNYWNYDNFQMILFPVRENTISISTRRRDGYNLDVFSKGKCQFQMPMHVKSHVGVQVDEQLLKGLLQVQKDKDKEFRERVWESIVNFNLANTDSVSIPEHSEIVLLIGAIERLLGCNRGKEDELAKRFIETLIPCSKYPSLNQNNRFKNVDSIREMWIRACFRLRGEHAHGKMETDQPLPCTTQEHCLFLSFVFPLLVKLILKDKKFYNLSDNDKIYIDSFEKLVVERHFNQQLSSSAPGNKWKWNKIIDSERSRRLIEQVVQDGTESVLSLVGIE